MRYLALGDSYSIGDGVPEAGRWPVQLAARLRAEGIALDDPLIVATTGWTTDELSAAMDATAFAPPYDLVSLLIGVNNQYRGRSADDYRGEFRRMLGRAVGLAGDRPERVLVLSIPDWGVTAFARSSGRDIALIAHELDVYNAIAAGEAKAAGAHWVDITGISRLHPELLAAKAAGAHWVDITGISRLHPELLAEDGLHPSAAQYTLWMEAALPVARSIISL